MKIAHFGRYRIDSANGVDRTVAGLARHLSESGNEIELWHASSKAQGVAEDPIARNLTEFRFPRSGPVGALLGREPEAARALVSQRSKGVSLVHCHSVFIPSQVNLCQDIRRVITPNGGYMPAVLSNRKSILKMLWLALREEQFVRGAAALHAVSKPEASWLSRRFGHPRVRYIPNGVCASQIASALEAAVTTVPRRLFFLGRLAVAQKGLDLLLAGFARSGLAAAGFELVIAGEDFRNGADALRAEAAERGIGPAVSFPGKVVGEEKAELFQSPAIFIHTSRWEGMPFALLEALASGKPVFITPETNIADDVLAYDAGWVVAGHEENIASGLSVLASLSPAEYNRKSANALRLVREKYSWDQIAKEMEALYREIADEG